MLQDTSVVFSGCDSVFDEIRALNEVWGNHLPPIPVVRPNTLHSMLQFQHILAEEMNEFTEIALKASSPFDAYNELDLLTDLSDWFGDMIVYLVGESAKYGIKVEEIITIINDSNASKLGEDGKAIKDPSTGKVQKGPNFFKPEPAIAEYLAERRVNHDTHLV